jgi:hypothetical protein
MTEEEKAIRWLLEFLGDEVITLELVQAREWVPEEVDTGYDPRHTVLGRTRKIR